MYITWNVAKHTTCARKAVWIRIAAISSTGMSRDPSFLLVVPFAKLDSFPEWFFKFMADPCQKMKWQWEIAIPYQHQSRDIKYKFKTSITKATYCYIRNHRFPYMTRISLKLFFTEVNGNRIHVFYDDSRKFSSFLYVWDKLSKIGLT